MQTRIDQSAEGRRTNECVSISWENAKESTHGVNNVGSHTSVWSRVGKNSNSTNNFYCIKMNGESIQRGK